MNRREFLKRLFVATAVLPLVTHIATDPPVGRFPEWNWIDLPAETGDITALVPHGDSVLAFTQRAIYRIDYVGQPFRFNGRRFRAMRMDFDVTRVVTEQLL